MKNKKRVPVKYLFLYIIVIQIALLPGCGSRSDKFEASIAKCKLDTKLESELDAFAWEMIEIEQTKSTAQMFENNYSYEPDKIGVTMNRLFSRCGDLTGSLMQMGPFGPQVQHMAVLIIEGGNEVRVNYLEIEHGTITIKATKDSPKQNWKKIYENIRVISSNCDSENNSELWIHSLNQDFDQRACRIFDNRPFSDDVWERFESIVYENLKVVYAH